jgi:signal transduction histidine kinase
MELFPTSASARPARENANSFLPTSAAAVLRYIAAFIALAIVYIAAARAGLKLDAIAGFATLVWAPTGIALAALLLYGYDLAPAIFIGAFVVNVWTGAPVLVALGIALGNTLEAIAGTFALRRIPGFRPALDRLEDVAGLIVVAAGFCTMISASIGVTSLALAGMVSTSQTAVTWRAWWLGDIVGALVVAPLLLVWLSAMPLRVEVRRLAEVGVSAAALVCIDIYIFGSSSLGGTVSLEQTYLVFPPLIFAALRFGQRGAVTAAFLTTLIAVWGTVSGNGPFARPVLNQGLFSLQTFMAVATATFLLLGASVAERQRTEQWLRHAREIAERANRAKSDFLAVMSHELRTPLNAIAGYVDLLSMEVGGPVTTKQREFLSRIQSSQGHLLALIDEVLGFARIETGRVSLSLQPVIIFDAIVALEGIIELELQKKRLTWSRDLAEPSLAAHADPEKLRQILLNLVANGVKFTPEGGRISIGAMRERDTVRVWVSDTGIGIPSDQLAHVFDPYFQVDRGPTRKYPGMGLGLAIARDLARAMHGEVWMESTPGAGSTAWLVLPAA